MNYEKDFPESIKNIDSCITLSREDFVNFINILVIKINSFKDKIIKESGYTAEELAFALPIYQVFNKSIAEKDIKNEYSDEAFYPSKISDTIKNLNNKKYSIKNLEDLKIYEKIFRILGYVLQYGDYQYCKDNNLKKYVKDSDKPSIRNPYGTFYILKFEYLENKGGSKVLCLKKIEESLASLTTNIKDKLKVLLQDYIDVFTELNDLTKSMNDDVIEFTSSRTEITNYLSYCIELFKWSKSNIFRNNI